MAKNSAGVEMSNLAPELYGHYATYTRKGTANYVVVPFPPTCPHPYDDEGKEAYLARKEAGLIHIGGPRPVHTGPLHVGTRAVSSKARTSDKVGGRLACTYEGCDWWCSAANPHKARKHESKKSGHTVE
jgi:hypothetical protein